MATFTLEDLRKEQEKGASTADQAPASFSLAEVQSPAYRKGREESDPLFRGFANVINGPTFGFGDEIAGALMSVPLSIIKRQGIGDSYQQARDFVRGAQDQYKEDFPIGSPLTQLAASAPVVTANPLGAVGTRVAPQTAAAVTRFVNTPRTGAAALGTRTLVAGGSGAAYGGVTGLGESTAEDPLGLTLDTGKGALTGFGLSAATPLVGSMAMGGYNQAATRLSQNAAVNYARQKVAEALSRDAKGSVFESGASNAGSQAASRFFKLGPEARIVDAGGQNTRQLLDTTATLPGRTKNLVETAIHDRQAGRADRMTAAADQAMGVNGRRLNEGIEGWIQARRMAATPLYAQAHRIQVQPTNELRALVQAAEQLGAGAQGRRIATANRAPYTLNASGQAATPGSSLLNNGQAAQAAHWSMRDLDHLKQGLDDIVQANIDQTGHMNKLGFAADNLRRQLIAEMDRVTTGPNGQSIYRQARETYAGQSALIDAARRGRTTFLQDEAAIRQAMQGMTASEMDAFRLGAFEALRGKLGKMSGQTEIMNMWRDRATREKLQAVFGDERSYRQFAATVAREARLKGLESVGRGSQTAARHYGAGDLDVAPVAQAVTAASQGSPLGLLTAGANLWNRVRTPEAVRDQIGSILLSRDPITMRDLELLTPLVTAERNRRAMTAGGFAGLLGN